MKKLALFVGGAVVGYFLNTKTGKNLRNWAYTKAQETANNFVGKINEVTTTTDTTSTSEEEGK